MVNKGVTAILPFNLYNANGQLADADVLDPVADNPVVVRIMVNGEITTVTGVTIEQQQDSTPAAITGRYQCLVPTSDLAFNDFVQVQIKVVRDGMTLNRDLTFSVTNDAAASPRIEII